MFYVKMEQIETGHVIKPDKTEIMEKYFSA